MKKTLTTILLLALFALIGQAQTKQEADSLHQLGRTLLEQGRTIEGREYTRQAMEMRKKLFGEKSEDYITSLNNYALSYTFGKDVDMNRAIELQQEVMKLCGKLKTPHPDFGRYALNMGRMYYIVDDRANAAKYWEQALVAVEKHSEMYESLLEWLGLIYSEDNDYANMQRIMALMEEHNRYELKKPCDEVKCMIERGQYYAETGDNAQAKSWFLQAIAIANGDEKVDVYEAYGKYLGLNLNDFSAGADYLLSAANLHKELSGENEDYYSLLNTAGIYYYLGKQFQKAIDCYLPVIDFYKKFDLPEARISMALCQKNLGNAYSAIKDYAKAKECFREALNYYKTYDQENEEYPKLIAKLATAEKFNKDNDESIEHYQQAMQIFLERNMMEDYSSTVSSLRLCYAYAGREAEVETLDEIVYAARKAKLDAIIKEETESLEMTRDYLGELVYARSLYTIAGCYNLEEDYGNAIAYYEQYMVAVRDAIRSEFSMQSEAERMTTWDHEKNAMQDMKEMLVLLPADEDSLADRLNSLVYDVALLSKGILLNSSIEFEKVLSDRGDAKLKALYDNIKANDAEIERLRMSIQDDSDLDKILQLTQQNQALQLQLYSDCKELADFTDYISYTWQDVKNALQPTDIAIEFVTIESGPIDDENYMVAMVLTAETPCPVLVPICTLEDVKLMASFDQLYEYEGVVWGLMGKILDGKRRIFFSADGGFNHIGIEYLRYDGKPLSEKFEVYRLSSTKELCYHHQAIPMDNVVLIGDINYNEEGVVTEDTRTDLIAMRGGNGEFANLTSTKKEVNEAQKILKKHVKKVAKLTDTKASQAAFLELSGTQVNLIHIATHGLYNAVEGASETESMQNSILAFAGANLYEDTHDGIVTAADIAKMNLRRCDLAVLSACETGLGQLGDDGVFGLQRGFKNAGVHSLLMSIKKVYDNTTADMMILFYSHLVEGFSKREALVKAQQEIRDSGYTDAKYWASFILLDAIE